MLMEYNEPGFKPPSGQMDRAGGKEMMSGQSVGNIILMVEMRALSETLNRPVMLSSFEESPKRTADLGVKFRLAIDLR